MTDKQIIIDDIDVSGCAYYMEYGECINENVYPDYCKACSNCTYKLEQQLKHKEQECEELKKYLHQNFKEKDKLHLIIDRLLEASGYDTNTASAEDFEDVYENMRYEKQQLDRYKQTLTEIKEIAEKVYNDCDDCYRDVDTNCDVDCIDCTLGGKAKLAEQILQKISECEVENA